MLAAIDVGSNTVRLLIGDVDSVNSVRPLLYQRHITRLKGSQTEEGLAPEAMERTLFALRDCMKTVQQHPVSDIIAVGTEALRSAANSAQFVDKAGAMLNLDLRIISAEEEARACAAGVLAALDPKPDTAVIVDIGGGSTEFIVVRQGEILFQESLTLGVVALAEVAAREQQYQSVSSRVAKLKADLSGQNLLSLLRHRETVMVGTAGTITTLAAIDMNMQNYDWKLVNNYRISHDRITAIREKLEGMSTPERETLAGMEKGRGDLIIPGIQILLELMSILQENGLTISDFGLLEGTLLQLAERSAFD